MTFPFAEIHLPIPNSRGYTYRVPQELDRAAVVGCRALVPLGKRQATGLIAARLATTDIAPERLKDIHDVLDDEPLFDQERFELAKWIAEYYLASLGEALRAMLPPGLEKETSQFVRLVRTLSEAELQELQTSAPRQAEVVAKLQGKKGYRVSYLVRHLGYRGIRSSIRSLKQQGLVEVSQRYSRKTVESLELTYVRLSARGGSLVRQDDHATNDTAQDQLRQNGKSMISSTPLTEKQRQGLQFLQDKGEMTRVAFRHRSGLSDSVLRSLIKKSLVTLVSKEISRSPYQTDEAIVPSAIVPNDEQKRAVAQIAAKLERAEFGVFLLHGITGSGKTQVYIEAIRKTLELGKEAIVLVPEISLTPQTVARFQANFGQQIAVLHSRLSTGERYDEWRRVQRGEARVVIGARSAVFAPVRRLGLIVIDEEHETSYKQIDPPPRYHARDVAIVRCQKQGAAVVIGSATPAIESYYNALSGKYQLLELPSRIDNVPLPAVRLIDMMRFRSSAPDAEGVFSRILFNKIAEKLERREQIILLQNRRGFAPVVRCVKCGYSRECQSCDIPLTFHQRGHAMRCHYCGFIARAPDVCPQCGSLDLIFKGIGTQRVENALQQLLPAARIVRMDLDTTRGKLAHDKILKDFEEHRYDILLGTQMIAKGLDFHRVTLVGVISADLTLLRPDFRSGERTFQLLTQVAGRAGRRDLPGEVIIQTYSPEDFALLCAQKHDFKKFFAGEIEQRRQLQYPPLARVAMLLFRHRDNERAGGVAEDFAVALRQRRAPVAIYGPSPALLQRIQDEYRWQLMVKSNPATDPGASQMRRALSEVLQAFHTSQSRRRVRVHVDIDPVTMS